MHDYHLSPKWWYRHEKAVLKRVKPHFQNCIDKDVYDSYANEFLILRPLSSKDLL